MSTPGVTQSWVTALELPADGLARARFGTDIIQFDLRGALIGKSIQYHKNGIYLKLEKTDVKEYLLDIVGVLPEKITVVDNQVLTGAGAKTLADTLQAYSCSFQLTIAPDSDATLSNSNTPASIQIAYTDSDNNTQTLTATFSNSVRTESQTETLPAGATLTEVTATGWSAGNFNIAAVPGEAISKTETVSTFPEYPIWVAGQTKAAQTATEIHENSVAPNLAALVVAAKTTHATLQAFMDRLAEQKGLQSNDQISVVRNHIFWALHAVFIIVKRDSRAGTDLSGLSIQNRIDYCNAVNQAPLDVTDVGALGEADRRRTRREIFNNLPHTGNVLDDAPTTPQTWVNPFTGKRIKIKDIKKLSVGTASFTPDGETDSVAGLGLESVQLQSVNSDNASTFFDPNGGWTDTLTE